MGHALTIGISGHLVTMEYIVLSNIRLLRLSSAVGNPYPSCNWLWRELLCISLLGGIVYTLHRPYPARLVLPGLGSTGAGSMDLRFAYPTFMAMTAHSLGYWLDVSTPRSARNLVDELVAVRIQGVKYF